MMISFSGIDGSGKGTQIRLLEAHLIENGIKFKTIWARGSWTPGVELIKKVVRQDRNFSEVQKEAYRREARTNPKKQKIILILSIMDLLWFFGVYYRFLKIFNKVVICDRYIWDTLIDFRVNFSGYEFEKWLLWKLLIMFIPYPNTAVILFITAEQSQVRGLLKKEANMESLEIKERKTKEYLRLIKEGRWTNVIDGSIGIYEIQMLIKAACIYEN